MPKSDQMELVTMIKMMNQIMMLKKMKKMVRKGRGKEAESQSKK